MIIYRGFFVLIVGLLTGCTAAEWDSINRTFNPTSGDSRLIDAKQRAIISVRRPELDANGRPVLYQEGHKVKKSSSLVVCAEPSPDALQATATALAADASSEQVEAVLKLALSNTNTAASIGLRTQTIQLLRDAYYRLCEAYLGDGIDSIAFDVMQRRFQNQITALLAIEQLTGTVTAAQAGLNTTASADAGANAALLSRELEKARDEEAKLTSEKEAAEKQIEDLTAKETALNESIENRTKEIETEKEKYKEGSTVPVEEQAAAREKVKELEAEQKADHEKIKIIPLQRDVQSKIVDAKTKSLATNATLIESLNTSFQAAAQKTITSSSTGAVTFTGGTTSNKKHEEAVVHAVRAIALNALNQDYDAQVCFETLRFRTHAAKYKNSVSLPKSFISLLSTSDMNQFGTSQSAIEVFSYYCSRILNNNAEARAARTNAINERSKHIGQIIDSVRSNGGNRISAGEAVDLILALQQATPLNEATGFLSTNIKFGQHGSNNNNSNGGTTTTRSEGLRPTEFKVQSAPGQVRAPLDLLDLFE